MCGIVGIASRAPVRQPEVLSRMRDTMGHRGPDDAGLWWSPDRRIGLGHRRLAVIDPTPGGHQPMIDPETRVCLVYNGEIYNYRELRRELRASGDCFRSASDSEVILHAYRRWGDGCLSHLRGMFAFALWDAVRRRLLLARDRCGEKPLFFWVDERGTIQFASELKALMANPALPRVLDREALEHYLAYAFVPGSRCILRDLRKLQPAHALSWSLDTGAVSCWRYWDPVIASPRPTESLEALTDELQRLLADAVRGQLVADVPVGVLLSGGLDSSVVTATAAAQTSGQLRTFTVCFQGHGHYDESRHARQVAAAFGTEHYELPAGEIEPNLLPLLARQFDEPMGDSSMLPMFLLATLVRQHATVALSGDGGDELFGGYRYYSWIPRVERLRGLVPEPVRRAVAAAARALPVGAPGRQLAAGIDGDANRAIAHVDLYFDAATRAALLRPLGQAEPGLEAPEAAKADACPLQLSVARRAMVGDFRRYLPDDVLVKVDRAGMLASLEVRAPFLDHRVADFALGSVPDAALAQGWQRKILLRRLGRRLLPASFDVARKQGFSVPLARWLRGPWGSFVTAVLSDADPRLFDRRVLHSLLQWQRRGLDNAKRLFALTLFELWRREYAIRVGA
jgi:asparagine synthase (glutamine-hydrolysing)